MTSPEQAELPLYTLRVSRRARRASLKVCPMEGVVVVVPPGFDRRHLDVFIDESRSWLEHQLRWLKRQKQPAKSRGLPRRIELPAIGAGWEVDYRSAPSARISARSTASGQLVVSGDTQNLAACRKALRRWLARQAKASLQPWLTSLADAHGLSFSRLTVRGQRTRWGSCSSEGNISLNYQLLFLDRRLVNCVLLHELCHTVHLNHGRRFYALLRRLEPQFDRFERELSDGWKHVPAWVYRPE